jgi:outer membrane lipoprotein-sorting protein
MYGFMSQSICLAYSRSTFMRRSAFVAAAVLAFCVPASIARAQTLDDIISANLKSKGGLETIKATTTVRMSGSVVARDMNGQNVTGTMVTVAKRPNLMRRDATVGDQKIVNAFDGTSLWMSVGNRPPQDLPGSESAYARQDAEFDSVFVDYKEKGHKVELVGKDVIDGKPAYHVRVIKKAGPPQDYYLDAETGLERKVSVSLRAPDGTSATNVTEFLDYRNVDGRMVPFTTRQSQNGTVVATVTLDRVEFNVPIDDTVFKMPAKQPMD